MSLQDEMSISDVFVQELYDEHLANAYINLAALRLDKIHPVVSGNKWFKLKYYLQQVIENNYTSVATFGGAYSNHILATAYACNKQNIPCKGFIRGEQPGHLSQTLLDAKALNMQLEFISREAFANKQSIITTTNQIFFIPEGGYGKTGAKGAAEITILIPQLSNYTHIVCAVGTATMIAGIVNASMQHQQCVGISVLKNNYSLENEMLALVNAEAAHRVTILHDYHFGGYAKYTNQLIDFMNNIWLKHHLPLDFVYTAKALHAIYHLIEKKYFMPGSNILFIHSGGLQGNRSIKDGTLLYSY